ncbi:MAG: P-II family nitrogen regulator [Burkholderiales bacterium]
MITEKRKLVSIVTESALEQDLLQEIERLGARGYTVTDARGKGSRGVRNAGWEHSANIRIEVVCTPDIALAISTALKERYYDDYAMILFVSEVEILRPEKF